MFLRVRIVRSVRRASLILSQALQISETRDASRRLALTAAGVIFYGTPAAPQSLTNIKRTIRQCFTVELRQEKLLEIAISDQNAEHIQELLKLLDICKFEILCVFEKQESSWKVQRQFAAQKKKRIVHMTTFRGLQR